ncbi:Poly(rC)-binding protein 1 [Colletotrichum siamense]|uniref:Poly(RC)-binding protein 1 n=1 Tax=Colletotrichum siamense TaxID=690259 RepID=A0A9P5K847_COLSI|nr:Poly(rC)-binding protein 1 [Colletotrichum siamense]KAF4842695.1 Poly(rC)-binding protein 1 [Colletotrichum siamense]KAF4862932.1 Poly(rC)-binding protein 1 [Colletotrichum siamense]KAF5516854.1 Poly(rC)-binding protein 1 [Colletotrichum siamense]
MSASPTQPSNSAKRPLEETSSPSRSNDQPDAKRPALDKILKSDEEIEMAQPIDGLDAGIETPSANGAEKTNGDKAKSDQADSESTETKPIQSSVAGAVPATPSASASHDERDWIHIRAVISSPEAATVIGKGGENVSNIRKMSGAKCTVSDYQKGAVERILTVSGVVDAAAKAFGLIIRTLNNEPLAEPSSAQSKTYPLRLLIPHILIGSIIGKGGARIREIQEASGARLNASDSCLPLSTERSLVVMGVADAVHIATYYVGSTLLEQLNDRFGGPAASAYATRSGGPAGVVPGGMQVVPYCPQPTTGNYGNRENYNRRHDARAQHHLPAAPYAQPYPGHHAAQPNPAMPIHYGAAQAGGYGAAAPMQPHAGAAVPQPHGAHPAQPMHGGAMPGAPLTQQIYIPNDMVGAIIGKGGQKINEIRQISGSVIKINEPQDNSNERLVTITGTEECNRMALYMLYSRLESEKHRI